MVHVWHLRAGAHGRVRSGTEACMRRVGCQKSNQTGTRHSRRLSWPRRSENRAPLARDTNSKLLDRALLAVELRTYSQLSGVCSQRCVRSPAAPIIIHTTQATPANRPCQSELNHNGAQHSAVPSRERLTREIFRFSLLTRDAAEKSEDDTGNSEKFSNTNSLGNNS